MRRRERKKRVSMYKQAYNKENMSKATAVLVSVLVHKVIVAIYSFHR